MNQKKMNPVNVIKFAGAFVAFMIGSGFASGQEIMQFFTSYGLLSIGGALISMFLFSWCGAVFMGRGYENKDDANFKPFQFYCGKVLGTFFEYFTPCFLFCVVVVMVSGAGATINQYFGLPNMVGVAAMAVLSTLSVLLGLKRLVDIIGLLGPFTIIFTMIIAIYTLATQGGNLAGVDAVVATLDMPAAAPSWWIAGILYVAYNGMGSVPFFNATGALAGSKKEAQWGAILGGILLMAAGLLVNLAMLCDIETAVTMPIPVLHLSSYISPVFGTIFSFIIIGEIFSTAAPMLWVAADKCAVEGTIKHKVITIVLGVVALIGGQLPFGTLVGIVYPYTGYLGIILFVIVAVKEYILLRKNK